VALIFKGGFEMEAGVKREASYRTRPNARMIMLGKWRW
jgi:hypothetical protein